ncbi:tail fiber domain-containing protein [bacterium SCSIO 12741]|nr:tail fiber domain-containing protein [bacterium SCSIO 12741]
MDWSNGAFVLQTAVDFSGGTNYTVLGVSPLVSVPFALHAENVTNDKVYDGDSSQVNELQMLSVSNDTLYLSQGGSVVLSRDLVFDGDSSLTNELQTLSITKDTIYLTDGGSVVLPPGFDGNYNSLTNVPADKVYDGDSSATNEIQSLSMANNVISLTNGGSVTLPNDSIFDGDSSMTNEIQTLSISGTSLSLSKGGGSVTLPSGGGGDNISDTDNDTKIEVEKAIDEDLIRFTVEGDEKWRMDGNALEEGNNWDNIFIGVDVGDAILPGAEDNVIIGSSTGTTMDRGDRNTIIGTASFTKATSGDFNSVVGNQTTHNLTSGNLNSGIGAFVFYDITTGSNNSALGQGSLSNLVTGNYNVGLGRATGLKVTTGHSNVFIGDQAGGNTATNISNKLYIDNTNTNSPLIYGDFLTNELTIHGKLMVDGDLVPKTANTQSLGATNARWAAVYATNGTIQTSDVRLKKNIRPLEYGLSTVLEMRAVSYNWKDTARTEDKIGFIAQELEQLIPEVVIVGEDSAQTRGVNYAELVPVLVKAIQELEAKNKELVQANAEQQNQFDELEAKLDQLMQMYSLQVTEAVK